MRIAVLLWLTLAVSAAPALAQQQSAAEPLVQQRFDELAKWLRKYHEWENWFAQWGNRVARNFNSDLMWDRKERPEPPPWLDAECQSSSGVDGLLASACYILRHWDEQPLLILQRRNSPLATSGGKVTDKVVKTSFLQRVHLSGLWVQAQYPATHAYGIVGMQVGVFEAGRFTLPAIGVMLVMIPDGQGGHDWKPASTVGFGYRLFDFVAPLMKKEASLHFNITRTIIHGVQDERILPGMLNVNLVGLSVSAKKGR
jgi:hypothetical protein